MKSKKVWNKYAEREKVLKSEVANMKTSQICRHDNKMEDGRCPICMSTREPQHTPTPWMIGKHNDHDNTLSIVEGDQVKTYNKKTVTAYVPDVSHYAEGYQRSNAEFIVRAVNAHEELLRVCKLIYETENEKDDFCQDWMGDLRQAIAKAEGK